MLASGRVISYLVHLYSTSTMCCQTISMLLKHAGNEAMEQASKLKVSWRIPLQNHGTPAWKNDASQFWSPRWGLFRSIPLQVAFNSEIFHWPILQWQWLVRPTQRYFPTHGTFGFQEFLPAPVTTAYGCHAHHSLKNPWIHFTGPFFGQFVCFLR